MQVAAAKPPPQWLLLILRYCLDLDLGEIQVKYVVNDRVRFKCLFAFSCYVFSLRALYAGSGGEAAPTMVVVDSSILFGFR